MSRGSAEEIASLSLIPEKGLPSQIAQTTHRFLLLETWGGIQLGGTVLELGCGQGDCTAVIADRVGDQGSVDAIDPAAVDYGAPFTLAEAQKHLSASRLGPRINWIQADLTSFLSNLASRNTPTQKYDIGILAHCLWYFSSPSQISSTLQLLSTICNKIYVAEWSLSSSSPAAQPHVLATLTQASLECRKPQSDSNVRTVVSPDAIKKLAQNAGLKLEQEAVIVPNEGLLDGRWEVGAVVDKAFVTEVAETVKDERERAITFALRDAMLSSLKNVELGVKGVRCMDVWCGVFKKE